MVASVSAHWIHTLYEATENITTLKIKFVGADDWRHTVNGYVFARSKMKHKKLTDCFVDIFNSKCSKHDAEHIQRFLFIVFFLFTSFFFCVCVFRWCLFCYCCKNGSHAYIVQPYIIYSYFGSCCHKPLSMFARFIRFSFKAIFSLYWFCAFFFPLWHW